MTGTNLDKNAISQMATITGMTEAQVLQMMQLMQTMAAQQVTAPQAVEPEPQVVHIDYYPDFNNGKIDCVKTEEQFYEDALYVTMYKFVKNEITRNTLERLLEKKAKEIGGTALAKMFNKNCSAVKKRVKKEEKEEAEQAARERQQREQEEKLLELEHGNMTKFTNLPDYCTGNKYIGAEWEADDNGIRKMEENGKTIKIVEACSYPIVIDKMYCPLDTAADTTKKFDITFKSESGWQSKMVTREQLVNANKAIGLSADGVGVNSENAKGFILAMSSMLKESAARGALPVVKTLNKLGWDKDFKNFLPFTDEDFLFERQYEFPELMDALAPHGDRDKWYEKFKEIRKKNYLPFKIATLASLASPLISMLPKQDGFVVDLYGPSGYGKSTSNLIATSIWGDISDHSPLVHDSVNTINAIEQVADVWNNLPVILEDASRGDEKKKMEYQTLVMMLANGRGKGRLKKDLTMRKKTYWKLAVLTTSEQNITNNWTTSGSVYRVISILVEETIPIDIPEAMAFFQSNYGHCGRDFIECVKKIEKEDFMKIYSDCLKRTTKLAKENGKEQRQAVSMAVMLTADEISEKYLFQDGVKLTDEEILSVMVNPNDADQYARFYRTVIDFVAQNPQKFEGITDPEDIRGELCGVYRPYDDIGDKKYPTISFIPSKLRDLMQQHCVDSALFYNYLRENGLLCADAGRNDTKITIKKLGYDTRVIKMKMPDLDAEEVVIKNPFSDRYEQLIITD